MPPIIAPRWPGLDPGTALVPLGAGGFAAVWAVGDGLALKVAHADHELARARMSREAAALREIGAPAVPRLIDAGVLDDRRPWILMERLRGATFAELLAEGPSQVQAIELAIGACAALGSVHAARFVHRDVKPDNLLLRDGGAVAILDLGLARRLPTDPDDPTRKGIQVGSPEYLPPEQLRDAGSVDPRADIYGLGCVIYELLTGRPPFLGDAAALERAHVALRPSAPGALVALPPALDALVLECLAKEPSRRPATTDEVARRLRALGAESSQTTEVRGGMSVSVIREGRQPVVLVWVELPRVDRALLGLLAARHVVIASQRGRRVLGGLLGADHADPAAVAVALARELAASGAKVALHLELVQVNAIAGAHQLVGEAIERPESWLPAAAWAGVVLTRAASAAVQLPIRPAEEVGDGFVRLAEAGEAAPLVGRDGLLGDLMADAAAALGGAGPGLAVVVGDPGVGKTALVRALASRLAELEVTVHVGTLPVPGGGRPSHDAVAPLLDGPVSGSVVREVGEGLRAAARKGPLVVILDDLHLGDHEFLDALELATLGGEPLPLWIIGAAAPRLDVRRPGLGGRAERSLRASLPALDEEAAVALTTALLAPVAYPPLRALRQLAQLARGNPMHLTMIAREIHERGAIRQRPGGEAFLDTTALDALPPLALGPWLAARELAPYSPEVAGLARVCAVLGEEFGRDELLAVIELVERGGGTTTPVDADVGLGELVAGGMLVAGEAGFAFRQGLLVEGIYETTEKEARRDLHVAALRYWQGRDGARAEERVARHAEAVGDREAAAVAFAAVGARAQAEFRDLDADLAWQGALRNLGPEAAGRGAALVCLAKVLYRLQRTVDALAALDQAAACATRDADIELTINVALDQATVLDRAHRYDEAGLAIARAQAALAAADAPELALALELALGRAAFRAGRPDEVVERLRRVAMSSVDELAIIARLLLGPAQVTRGHLADAEHVFTDLMNACTRIGDQFHLGAAYANRPWLWWAQGDAERGSQDLRSAIAIARELGVPEVERAASHNLAEDQLWQGNLDEALRLALRSLAIQRGNGEGSVVLDQLLVARVRAARGERREVAELLAQLDREDADFDAVTGSVLSCVANDANADEWALALALTDAAPTDQRLELAHLGATAGQLHEPRRSAVVTLATTHQIWSRRQFL